MVNTRIYAVQCPTTGEGQQHRLVEATSASAAIRHVTKGTYSAKVPDTKQLASLMQGGIGVEKAEIEVRTTAATN